MSGALLELRGIGVVVSGNTLLRDISLAVAPGEILAILGANGAGKSTLIETLSAAIVPTTGEITFGGRPLAGWSLSELAGRRALNASEPAIAFALRVDECVALGRPFERRDERAIAAALDDAHAVQWAARDYATLSSGEQMRVQVARALYQLGNTADCLWLLDEPCAHLDIAQRQFVLTLIERIARARRWAVVFSTHDPAEAAMIADRALLVRAGSALAFGPVAEMLTEDRLSACYGVRVATRTAFVATG